MMYNKKKIMLESFGKITINWGNTVMSEKKAETAYQKVSIGGWMGTLILSAIPGLNLILWIIWACGAKRPSRRTFAIACLLLTLICAALAALAITLYGQEILEWARQLDPELFSKALTEG